MSREKDARGSTFRSTSGAKPVILSGSCSIFTLSEMKHQKNPYNDNKVEIASWSIHTILGTPECLNTVPLAEMAPNRTFNFRYRLSALFTYMLTWGDRLSRTNMVRHTAFGLTPKNRNVHRTSSSAPLALVDPRNIADAPCEFQLVSQKPWAGSATVRNSDFAAQQLRPVGRGDQIWYAVGGQYPNATHRFLPAQRGSAVYFDVH
jgi:hypothetical protein